MLLRCRSSRKLHYWILFVSTFILFLTLHSTAARAFQPPERPPLSLKEKEFSKPELYISSSSVPLDDIRNQLTNSTALENFSKHYGGAFHVHIDPRSGAPTSIIGHIPMIPGNGADNHVTHEQMGLALGRQIRSVDAQVVGDLIKSFVHWHKDTFNIDTAQLGAAKAWQISDQLWQVSIPQEVKGIKVRHGRVAATISHGNLVLIGTDTWGKVRADTKPTIAAKEALKIGFQYADGQQPKDEVLSEPALEIVPIAPSNFQNGEAFNGHVGQGYDHRLVWTFTFRRPSEAATWEVMVDAHTGEVLAFQDLNQYLTEGIKGGVYPLTNTGVCPSPDKCGVMASDQPMPFVWTGTGFTNSAGLFEYLTGIITTNLSGQYVSVHDNCGGISESGTGSINLAGVNGDHDCTSGWFSAGNTAAARSAYYHLNKIQEMGRGYLPYNQFLQGTVKANVNGGGDCNAWFYPPAELTFYGSGRCGNTGELAAIVDHEWGHALDYNDGNYRSIPSESYADIAAMYRLQTSCIGHGFYPTGNRGCGQTADGTGYNTNIAGTGEFRCALNCSGVRETDWGQLTNPPNTPDTPANFSSSRCAIGIAGKGPCGREEHCESAVDTEAAWDFVARDLQGDPYYYDSNTAFIIANKIFYQGSSNINSWHSCSSPDTSGCSGAYMQWLAADDDDGNINNGTPHMMAIYNAFNRHGIACSTPAPVNSGCLGAPTTAPDVSIASASHQADLSWTEAPGATKYWVYRAEGEAGCDSAKTLISTVTGSTSFIDAGLANGRQYCYSIMAVGASDSCFTPASSCVCATPVSGLHGKLQGTVTDAATGNPISGAFVTASGGYATKTNSAGIYTFDRVFVGTYDVTATTWYGYQSRTFSGVSITDGSVTTQNLILDHKPIANIHGTVTDGSGHGWPLYAKIDIAAPGYSYTIYTNPETGNYSIQLYQDTQYSFSVSASGYNNDTFRSIMASSNESIQNFTLNAGCYAPGYEYVGGFSCHVLSGGLILGNVYNASGTAINGVTITDGAGHSTTTAATPNDPGLDDGFYTIFVPTGSVALTGSYPGYINDSKIVNVAGDSVTRQNLNIMVPCTCTIDSASASFALGGGNGIIQVSAENGCAWTVTENLDWVSITAGNIGTGNGTVNYLVSPNTTTSLRTGTMTVADQIFTVTQEASPLSIGTSILIDGIIKSQYSQTLTAISGTPSYQWLILGTLPDGLTLNSSTGLISGTPISTGTFTFTVQVQDAVGATATRDLSIYVSYRTSTMLSWGMHVQPNPTPISELNDITAIDASHASFSRYSMILKSDGTVWTSNNDVFDQVPGLSGVIAIAAGYDHSIVVMSDGTVQTWGGNANGQLGDGTISSRLTPSPVPGLMGIVAVAAGDRHSIALASDGTVWTWGYNAYGQVGDGSSDQRLMPFQIPELSGVIAIAAGEFHSMALKSDGSVWVWGYNGHGQLGIGTTNSVKPVRVPGFSDSIAISAGSMHSMAVKKDGKVWACGYNAYGQLGDGTTTDQPTPVQVLNVSRAMAVDGGHDHSLAVTLDGTVWAWGDNESGQLGDGTYINQSTPVELDLRGVTAISAGSVQSLGLIPYRIWGTLSDATVGVFYNQTLSAEGGVSPYIWAKIAGSLPSSSDFSLNPSTGVISGTPNEPGTFNFTVQVTDSNGAPATRTLSISVYEPLSIVTSSLPDGIVGTPYNQTMSATGGKAPYEWSIPPGTLPDGLNLESSTGVISGTSKAAGTFNVTVQVRDASDRTATITLPISIYNVLSIVTASLPDGSVGQFYSQTLTATGGKTPYLWLIPSGILPAGLTLNSSTGVISGTPTSGGTFNFTVQVKDAKNTIATRSLSINVYYSSIMAWGGNGFGALGDGTDIDRYTPIEVQGLSGMVAVSAGQYHTMALKSDGRVWTWGYNGYGQLGDTTLTDRYSPVEVPGLSGVIAIAGGYYHSLALTSTGTVLAWGNNSYNELGDGTTTNRTTPGEVTGLTDVIAIAGGDLHSLALKRDRTVWAWGYHISPDNIPVPVPGLSDVIAIAGVGGHSLALKSDGTVLAWGSNSSGQLGDGTTTDSHAPVQVLDKDGVIFNGVIAIAAGSGHSMALKSNGTVWAWGNNGYGQIGNASNTNQLTPVQVLSGATAIASKYFHSIALKEDGTVWAWGANWNGQLGDGTTINSSSPVRVLWPSSATAISAGAWHSLALIPFKISATLSDGIVGVPYNQVLSVSGGVSPYTWTVTPDSLPLPTGLALNPSTGVLSGTPNEPGTFNFTVQVTDSHGVPSTRTLSILIYDLLSISTSSLPDGTVGTSFNQTLIATGGKAPYSAWQITSGSLPNGLGLNSSTGRIFGTPTTQGTFNFTVQVQDANDTTAAATYSMSVYYASAMAWGFNYFGQLGDGTTNSRTEPVQVSELSGVTTIAGGYVHSLALKSDRTVLAWGYNGYGQLGYGTLSSYLTPSQVPGLSDVIAIAAGYNHSVALKSDGTVLVWGNNSAGQLGDGTTTNRTTPGEVPGLTGVIAIAGGYDHSLAVKADGSVWAWGSNEYGQLGDGTISSYLTPSPVPGLSSVIAVSGGMYYSLAVISTGTVLAWGNNAYGQLGDGTIEKRLTPVQVIGLDGVIAVVARGGLFPWVGQIDHSLALKSDGTVWAWGKTYGSQTQTTDPTQVPGLSDVVAISDGSGHSLALIPFKISLGTLPDGMVGISYNQTLSVSGGISPYTWTILASALPPGLTLTASTGVISGIPTEPGTFNFTVQVADATGTLTAKALSIVVYDALSITTTTLLDAIVGTSYSQILTATGGKSPHTWSIASGSLPDGLTLNTSTGEISGTPTLAGTINFAVQAQDANNATTTKALSISIYNPLSIGTSSLPFGTVGALYSQTLTATGGKTPYAWSIAPGSLPAGLSLNISTGEISGTPTAAGAFNFTVQVQDANNATTIKDLSLSIYDPLIISTQSLPFGTVGALYNQTVSVTGGKTPYTWSILSGNLPDGMMLNSSTGEISGTPTTLGTFNFMVQAQDANNTTTMKPFSIVIYDPLVITTSSLPNGILRKSYSQTLIATGGKTPYTWSILSGNLPDGLMLNSSTGEISGTPTTLGTFNFTVQLMDANNTTATKDLSITIARHN